MRYVSRGVFGVVAALAAVVITTTAVLAAPKYHDTVSGFEYATTSTAGSFAGQASGDLPGYWNTTVAHEPLTGSTTPTAITGGSFTLGTTLRGQPTVVSGQYTGGSITQLPGPSGCTNQTFHVVGTLANVGPAFGLRNGTGTFDGTLTHYRFASFGSCITYGATVAGNVDLSF